MPLKVKSIRQHSRFPLITVFFCALSYRVPLPVKHCLLYPYSGHTYPLCPRCDISMEREYVAFCDRCGQRLNWSNYEHAKIIVAPRKKDVPFSFVPDINRERGVELHVIGVHLRVLGGLSKAACRYKSWQRGHRSGRTGTPSPCYRNDTGSAGRRRTDTHGPRRPLSSWCGCRSGRRRRKC